jgi:collagen triple helix repeat protein
MSKRSSRPKRGATDESAGGFGRGGRLLLALAAGAAVFGIATAVQATIPDSKGVIHACYAKISGALRVIDTAKGQTCSGSEYGVNRSRRGPTGSGGPTGQPGTPGQPGAKGATGPQGVTGATGATGAFGPMGSQGDPGSPGTPGTDGQDVTGTALAVGDAHCPNGGTLLTATNGPFYACNGSDGSGGFGTGYQTVGTGQVAIIQDGSDVVSLTIPNGAPASAVYLVTARVAASRPPMPASPPSARSSPSREAEPTTRPAELSRRPGYTLRMLTALMVRGRQARSQRAVPTA